MRRIILTSAFIGSAAAAIASEAMITRELFAKTADGEAVEQFTITNKHGAVLRLITWGASITELHVPDRDGKLGEVTLGFESPSPWLQPHPFFGCIAGRYANRIAKGRFTLDGMAFELAVNNGPNHLHGGKRGFDKRNWSPRIVDSHSVEFSYRSPSGEEGYPGTLDVSVTYSFTDSYELILSYSASTDAPTVLNLTNHTYWNLGPTQDILAHELQIFASRFTAVDSDSIPTGALPPAIGAMDFTSPHSIGRDIAALKDAPGGGYDHNFVINDWTPGQLTLAAELHDPASGRTLRVRTTEPGIQFYTGNYLNSVAGRDGRTYNKHAGVCLETQHFPDSPNQPDFPSTVLRPGQHFASRTIYEFSTR